MSIDLMVNSVPTLDDVVDRTCDRKCSCCGSCCTEFLPVTKREVGDIRKWLEAHPCYEGHYILHDGDKSLVSVCPFHNPSTGRCDIYDVRPFVCRDFICCRSKDLIERKRMLYAKRAYYNSFLAGNETRMISFHALFFGNWRFDLTYRHLGIAILCRKLGRIPPKPEDEAKLFPLLADDHMKGGDNQ